MPKGTLYVADRDLHGKRGYWVVTPVLVGRQRDARRTRLVGAARGAPAERLGRR